MPKRVEYAEGERFTLIYDWYQPQDTAWRLLDSGEPVFSIDCDKAKLEELKALCDLMNGLDANGRK